MASDPGEGDFDHSEIEVPTVVGLIRNILTQYPDSGQILKELIQNAEDARASQVEVLYTARGCSTEGVSNIIKPFLTGGGICVYNDGVFGDADWQGIRRLSESVKRSDPTTVGRFGLGFKSVFHITDYVTILSGNKVLFMNPCEPESRMCRVIHLSKLHQHVPIDVCLQLWGRFISINELRNGNYNGTIFWFPLRVSPSKLSDNVYTHKQAVQLFDSFATEGSMILIFLRSLEKVSLQMINSPHEKNPVPYMVVELQSSSMPTIRTKRQEFCTKLDSYVREETHAKVICYYDITIRTILNGKEIKSQYSILHFVSPKGKASLSSGQWDNSQLPLVGVAAPLDEERNAGQLFCFLPLPRDQENCTDLPVLVNGYFVLNQNRRHVLWKSAEIMHDNDVEWNEFLIDQVLPIAYLELIKIKWSELAKGNLQANVFYQGMPSVCTTHGKWQVLARKLWNTLKTSPIIYSAVKKVLLPIDQAIITNTLDSEEEVNKSVLNTLIDLDSSLATLPDSIWESLCYLNWKVNTITPSLLLNKLFEVSSSSWLPNCNRRHLLEFILSDKEIHDQLDGLPLLPLANDSWVQFSRKGEKVYLCSMDHVQALDGIQHKILDRSLTENVKKNFEMISHKGTTQILKFDLALHGPLLVAESIAAQHTLNPDSASVHKWLSCVWAVLQNIPLVAVQDLTLLPTKPNPQMSDLITLDTAFIVTTDENNLSDNVCFSLKLLGVTVIRLETYTKHSDFHNFMCDSTGNGILKAIEKSINFTDITKLANTFNRNKHNPCSLIESLPIENIPIKVQNLLRYLEIFKATNHTGRNSLTSINNCSQVYPETCDFPCIFHETTIHARNNREMRLIKYLGASLLTIDNICLSSLKVTHTKESLEKLAVYIMNNHNLRNNQSLQMQLKLTKFVPNQQGILCQPSKLYDPLDEYAVILTGDMLPHNTFHNFIPFLKKLGLKQSVNMSSKRITKLVISLSKIDIQESFKKASMILKLINSHPDRNEICSMIRSVPCVPGSVKKPTNYPDNLHWNTSRRLYCPEEIKSLEAFGMTLGSVLPMADTTNIKGLADYFHWGRKSSAVLFIQHLKNVINCFTFSNALCIDLVRKCYLELYSFVNDDSDNEESFNELVVLPCILTKHGLKQPAEVYLEESNGDLDLKPYFSSPLFKSQEELTVFRYLGCLKDQSKELYLTLLKNLHDNGKSKASDLKLIINILERLEDSIQAEDQEKIFIPVETNNGGFALVPLAQCCYADHNLSWLNFDKDNNHEVKIIHKKIDINLAIALGVPPLQKQLLSCGIPIMKWGQSQPLTSRLRDLLEQYRDGVAVLKELVQNADDAGAQTVCFLYDERQNEDCRTGCMTPMLGEVQGPALWAYNDQEFSESDLENIIKLGGRTKEGKSTKIGKFGLGFCSVYNLTDVPSFMSGSNYIVFDPHMTYIERNDPGIRYDFSVDNNCKIINWFRSQFEPFQDVFEYKNGCNFNGTLFRLPLRTPSQATRSEISNVAYGSEQIIQLLKMFMEMAGNLLLFTQNVKEIKIYHLNKNSSPKESKLMFHTKREVLRSLKIDKDSFENVTTDSTQIQKVSELVTCFSNPFNEIIHLDVSVDITPVGKALCNLEEGLVNTSWIISWHSGGSELVEQAKNLNTLPLGAVALPLDKQKDGWMPKVLETLPTGFYKTSHLHCFLPLPIQTCFPVHVNGYFEVASDRRSIKLLGSDDRSGCKNWNLELIHHSIVPAYHNLLMFFKLEGLSSDYKYYSLWPLQKTCFDMLQHELAKRFYEEISEKDIQCFSDNGVWYSLSQSYFLEESFYSQEKVGELAFDFLDQYLETYDRKIIELPKDYIKELGDEVLDSVIEQEDFYLDYFIPNINENYIHEDERDDLVLFALEIGSKAVLSELSNIECIATQPYGKLKKPGSLVDPDSKVAALFSDCDERFPTKMFLKSSCIKDSLCTLGMMQLVVPGEILIERADSVRSMLCAQCAIERCKSILSYCSLINDNEMFHENEVSKLKNIKFLPVESKPPNWECSWAGDYVDGTRSKPCQKHKDGTTRKEIRFAKPTSLFTSSLKNLVGSSELVLDNDIHTSNVLAILGVKWNYGTVSYKLVNKQLHCLSMQVNDFNSKWLTDVCFELYKFLDTNLQDDPNMQLLLGSKADYDEYRKDIKDLQNEKVLLTKVGFQYAYVFTSNDNIDCSPDLFSTQNEILRWFPNLIKALEIKYFFGPEIIIEVLKLKSQTLMQVDLNEDDINQYSKLLIILSQELIEAKKSDTDIMQNLDLKNICLPNKNGNLQPAGELCTDDGLNNKTKRFSFIHPNLSLSNELTEALEIKTVTRKLLQESSDRIPFGQSEKLTTRIKNILEDYPCDEGIMKELLQNADDAGATEIAFFIDLRNHPTESLFDEKSAPLQGPALCIYNNSCFSAEDLKGISNLGDSTKKCDPESTGQYGIGFNAVYHITDAPSFLTRGVSVPHGEVLCMFDPLCKYDPDCTVQSPGVQYKNLNKLRECHPDSFKGYLEEDVMKGNGTLFRLPLRTDENSEISKRTFKVTEIDQMMKKFKTHMHESLLFLKNVRKISIQKIHPCGKRSVGYKVESSLDEVGSATVSQFKEYVKNQIMNSKGEDHIPLCNIKQYRVEYQMDIKDSENNSYKWHIVQQLGSNNPDKVPKLVFGAFCHEELKLLPHAGVAILLDKKSHTDVSHVVSCYLPLPSKSGLPFSIHGHFALNSSRRDLWTGEDSIKGLWNTWLIQEVLTPSAANAIDYFRVQKLPQDESVITEDRYLESMKSYYNLLPLKSDTMSGNWTSFVKYLYQYIKDKSLRFFDVFILEEEGKGKAKDRNPIASKTQKVSKKGLKNLQNVLETEKRKGKMYWHSLTGDQFPVYFHELFFSGLTNVENQNIKEGIKFSLEKTLKKLGMKIGSYSMFIKLWEAEMNPNLVTPDTVIEFLSSWQSEHSDGCEIQIDTNVEESPFLSVKNVAVMIEYLTGSEDFFEKINGLPLLVTQDNIIREFSEESPVFLSEFNGILPTSNQDFVHSELFSLIQKALKKYEEIQSNKNSSFHKISNTVNSFRIPDFAQRLEQEITLEYCSQEDEFISYKKIKERWLNRVWKFIESDMPKKSKSNILEKNQDDIDWDTGKSYLLEHLGKWALYPVVYKDTKLLIPIMHADKVLNFEAERGASPFKKLPVPIPDVSIGKIDQTKLAPSLNDPNSVLNILNNYHSDICRILQIKSKSKKGVIEKFINKDDALNILKYFSKLVPKHSLNRSQLKHLPFYEDLSNSFTCIDDKITMVLPYFCEQVPEGIKEMSERLGFAILICEHTELIHLYKYLDFSFHDHILDLYSTFILPNFDYLPEVCHKKHLEYLADHLKNLNIDDKEGWKPSESKVVNQLQRTEFIKYHNEFHKASGFYAPFNEIFKIMQMSYLPKEWCEKKWKKFLIVAGIIHGIKPDNFLEIARELSLEKVDEETIEEVTKKSKLLLTHFFKNVNEFEGHFDELKEIEFIVPEINKAMEEMLPYYRTTSGLISFSGSLPRKYAQIAWSATPILPSYAEMDQCIQSISVYVPQSKRNEYSQSLGIHSTPLPGTVQSHLNNVCQAANDVEMTNHKRIMLELLMDNIYGILNICEADVIQNLLEECVTLIYIPDHKNFVAPNNVVITLDEEIVPYIYKFPFRYGSYLPLFKEKFSVQPKATCEHYAGVLSMIYNITQNEELSPEERRSVTLAIKGLVRQEKLLEKLSVNELYLPSREGILIKSTELYVADNQDLERCIENSLELPIFHGFAAMEIHMDDALFVRLLPECVKPKFLTDVLLEVLDDTNLTEISEPILETIKNFLCRQEFIQSVLRITNHGRGKGLCKEDRETILKYHEAVEVKQFDSIETSYFFNGEKRGSRSRPFFVKKSNIDEDLKTTLYLEKNCPNVIAKRGLTDVYKNILEITDSNLVLILSSIFDYMKEPHELESYLDKMDLKSFGNENLDFFIPKVGSYLDPKMIDLLDNGFYSLHENEIVAMEKYLQGENDEAREDDTFIIVQVKSLVIERKEIMQSEYEVDIGEGATIVVSASQLFKFVRNKKKINESLGTEEANNLEIENYAAQLDTLDDSGFEGAVLNGSNNVGIQPDPEESMSEEEIMNRIKNQLIEIWKMTNLAQRRQLVRRLQLKWHPDKNSRYKEELCTRCFQYIQSLIARLERGESIPDEEDYNSAPKESPSEEWSKFFRRSSNNYYYNYRSENRQQNRKMSDRLEAQLWMKQAEHDFQAAQEEFAHSGSSCWISYKCYEATKNALIAALYLVDREQGKLYRNRTDITMIASALSDNELNHSLLMTAITKIEDRVNLCGNLRQPTHIQLPCDSYQLTDAIFIISKAEIVVNVIKKEFNE